MCSVCDAAVEWGFSVKLSFNGIKSIFMIFSSKRDLPILSLVVDNAIVPLANSCLYLGLTIDDKLNWNIHITKKCTAVKKLSVLNLEMLSPFLGPF